MFKKALKEDKLDWRCIVWTWYLTRAQL